MSSNADFLETARELRGTINGRCADLVGEFVRGPDLIKDGAAYCVVDGGKRLRAILCLWTFEALAGRHRDACLDMACAIEFMHAYSLVHDDLPCMDDDDLRRGKPSCHKKFGEAYAVLFGDALLNLCYEIVLSLCHRRGLPETLVLDTGLVIANAGGTGGLITGQVLDLQAEGKSLGDPAEDLQLVEAIHRNKTARLISASMEAGAVCAGADQEARRRIRQIGLGAGQAFQIVDDLLDIESSAEVLGKTPGKDAASGKATYPGLLGAKEARANAAQLIQEAVRELDAVAPSRRLASLFEFILSRSN
jgi:geranylgeranyl diphosphate synthase type II